MKTVLLALALCLLVPSCGDALPLEDMVVTPRDSSLPGDAAICGHAYFADAGPTTCHPTSDATCPVGQYAIYCSDLSPAGAHPPAHCVPGLSTPGGSYSCCPCL